MGSWALHPTSWPLLLAGTQGPHLQNERRGHRHLWPLVMAPAEACEWAEGPGSQGVQG